MTPQTTSWILALATGVTIVTAPMVAQETPPQNWLHVQVTGQGDDDERVALSVNVPLRAVGAVLAMVPEDIITSDGRLTVAEEYGVSVSAIRTMWQEVKAAGESEFVTLQRGDRTVRVARVGEQFQVRVEGDETVRVDLPIVVVDALLSSDGEALNFAAALEQLGELRGDIVSIMGDERQVRVWVDDQAVQ